MFWKRNPTTREKQREMVEDFRKKENIIISPNPLDLQNLTPILDFGETSKQKDSIEEKDVNGKISL